MSPRARVHITGIITIFGLAVMSCIDGHPKSTPTDLNAPKLSSAGLFPWSSPDKLWWAAEPAATPPVNRAELLATSRTVQAGQAACTWLYSPPDRPVTGVALRVQKNGDRWLQAHWGSHAPVGTSRYVGPTPNANGAWHRVVVDLGEGLSAPVRPGDTISDAAWAAFRDESDKPIKVWWDNCLIGKDDIEQDRPVSH